MVGVCYMELMLYDSTSLKNKRQVIKSIIQRSRQRFNIAVSETAYHDKWQRAGIEIAAVAVDRTGVDKILQDVLKFLDSDGRVEVINQSYDYF